MNAASLVLDIIIIAITALLIIAGYRRGFFKSVMTLCTGVASVLVAYTFTPRLSLWLKENFILEKLAGGLSDTLESIAGTGSDGVYDMTKLIRDSQFGEIVSRYGADPDKIAGVVSDMGDGAVNATAAAAKTVARAVAEPGLSDFKKRLDLRAEPIASTVSDVVAFVALFIGAVLVLKLITWLLGFVFRLPVLRTMDRLMGLVFGVLSALLFVWVFAMLSDSALTALSAIAPGSFSPDILNDSHLLTFFAKYNVVSVICKAAGLI